MAKNRESKTLHESFEKNIHPDIQERLKNLQSFGIDPELFAQFESRIAEIIENNPEEKDGVQAVVAGELEKTQLGMENAFSNYNREFRSLFSKAANDDFFADAA